MDFLIGAALDIAAILFLGYIGIYVVIFIIGIIVYTIWGIFSFIEWVCKSIWHVFFPAKNVPPKSNNYQPPSYYYPSDDIYNH